MFEAQFTRSFEPYNDGFVVYPSYKQGGKFVTVAERDALLADFRRNLRPAALLAYVLLLALFSVGWSLLSQALDAAAQMDSIRGFVVGLLGSSWGGWIISSPSRLVRGRPDMVDPRSKTEWRQLQLKNTAWWQLAVFLLGSAAGLYVASTLPEGSIQRLLMFGGSCLMLVFGFVHAFLKWRHQPA